MSRFYASISGSAKTQATRQGTPASGIVGHIRGWGAGVRVVGRADGEEDQFLVYLTGGSNVDSDLKYLGIVKANADRITFTPAAGLDYQKRDDLLDL